MGLFSSLLKNKKQEDFISEITSPTIQEEKKPEITIDLPEDEIVKISDNVIDTSSLENELKLKHNLEVLIKRAKKNNGIDNFVIIREDDIFPSNWEWLPCSEATTLEYESTSLSYLLRKNSQRVN